LIKGARSDEKILKGVEWRKVRHSTALGRRKTVKLKRKKREEKER